MSELEEKGNEGGALEPELVKDSPPVIEVNSNIAPPESGESIEQPSKVIRMGTMLSQLLEEVRNSKLDDEGRNRLRQIYDRAVQELGSALSEDLKAELGRLTITFEKDEIPTEAELRVAKAQLVGWLEGLVQGIQATLYAQQIAARQQLANIRGEISSPNRPPELPQNPGHREEPHGTYL